MNEERTDPVDVPHTELSAEALRGLIESFVLREGTDYGEQECSLEQKLAQVLEQLDRGEAKIVFYTDSETVDIVVSGAPRSRLEVASGRD